jgi:hypothetical protein
MDDDMGGTGPSRDNSEDIMADIWADKIESQIENLIKDNKGLRMTVLGIGGISLAALAGTGLMGMVVTKLTKTITQVAENQNILASAMGLVPQQGPMQEPTPPAATVDESKTVPQGNIVGEVHDMPIQEASDQAKALMEQDRANGINPRELLEGRAIVQPTAAPGDVPETVQTPRDIGKTS